MATNELVEPQPVSAYFRPNLVRFSAEFRPRNPSRSTGLVLQCQLHQNSARQTNSKATPLHQKNSGQTAFNFRYPDGHSLAVFCILMNRFLTDFRPK